MPLLHLPRSHRRGSRALSGPYLARAILLSSKILPSNSNSIDDSLLQPNLLVDVNLVTQDKSHSQSQTLLKLFKTRPYSPQPSITITSNTLPNPHIYIPIQNGPTQRPSRRHPPQAIKAPRQTTQSQAGWQTSRKLSIWKECSTSPTQISVKPRKIHRRYRSSIHQEVSLLLIRCQTCRWLMGLVARQA